MKTMQFIKDYLAPTARIVIIEDEDGVLYEGDVMSLSRCIVAGTYVVNIFMGDESDKAINIVVRYVDD